MSPNLARKKDEQEPDNVRIGKLLGIVAADVEIETRLRGDGGAVETSSVWENYGANGVPLYHYHTIWVGRSRNDVVFAFYSRYLKRCVCEV